MLKNQKLVKTGIILTAIMLLSLIVSPVLAADESYNPYGGGGVWGQILGFNWFDELIPVVWAGVSAYQGSELINRVSSGGGGYYTMFLPVGWYNLTVEEPGYVTKSMEIFVSSGSSTNINFVLELSYEPINKPKPPPPQAQYTFKISISGLPQDLRTSLYVDLMKTADIAGGETINLQFDAGSAHNVSVQKILENDGVRYTVVHPFLTVSAEGSYQFGYNSEYYLAYATEPANISLLFEQQGWHSAGDKILTPTAPALIEGERGVRYRFKSWGLDGAKDARNPLELTMDKPHSLKAIYTTEYLVEVTSPHGIPSGQGWYTAGSTVTISIQPTEGLLVRQVFAGWAGDYSSKESTAAFTVDKPMHIETVWVTDYTLLIVLMAVIIIALVLIILGVVYKRKRSSTQTQPSNTPP